MAITLRDQNHDRQLEPTHVVLKREVAIDSEEHVEVGLGQPEEFAVPPAGPAHFGNRSSLVPDQVSLQALR